MQIKKLAKQLITHRYSSVAHRIMYTRVSTNLSKMYQSFINHMLKLMILNLLITHRLM